MESAYSENVSYHWRYILRNRALSQRLDIHQVLNKYQLLLLLLLFSYVSSTASGIWNGSHRYFPEEAQLIAMRRGVPTF